MINQAQSTVKQVQLQEPLQVIVLHINRLKIEQEYWANDQLTEREKSDTTYRRHIELFESIFLEIERRLIQAGFPIPVDPNALPRKNITNVVSFLLCEKPMADFIKKSHEEVPILGLNGMTIRDYSEHDREWIR